MLGRTRVGILLGFVNAMVGHSPVTNSSTKSNSAGPPDEFPPPSSLQQYAVKVLSGDAKEDCAGKLWTS